MSNATNLEVVEGGAPQRIDPRFIVDLKGRSYPTWPGVLDLAHHSGLRGIEVKILQYPSEENHWTAVCEAIVTMEDGRTFCEIGDASPANTKLKDALLRISATRAKGRALRDAVNVGQTLLEEIGDVEDQKPAQSRGQPPRGRTVDTPAGAVDTQTGEVLACEARGCTTVLTAAQHTVSMKKFNRPLCPAHQKIADKLETPADEPAEPEPPKPDVAEDRARAEAALLTLLTEMDEEDYALKHLGLDGESPAALWLLGAEGDGTWSGVSFEGLTLPELRAHGRELRDGIERARKAKAGE